MTTGRRKLFIEFCKTATESFRTSRVSGTESGPCDQSESARLASSAAEEKADDAASGEGGESVTTSS
jgi:hypothetical protein